ncbi:FAD-dependent tricarballylate dehydrogenase TcuA [Salinibacterium sp. ZJ454]|uniref:FAD-dependent tricarballylate dehydrogenase TcuA n=1 Tax=Salinibacterium sp. ZJ454 TaxID=2708339 RepID=UPI00141D7986|nr:FAD-dependent tricarballylate dehydrogenase TcuA [Salinibacterium sp. ZJ454]
MNADRADEPGAIGAAGAAGAADAADVAGAAGGADVIVVGGGNAGFAAALAAVERGRRVVLLEKAPRHAAGGNSYYTAGATRITHGGLDDLRDILDADPRHERTVVPPYSAEEYVADITSLSGGRNDPERTAVLVGDSHDTLRWLHGLGMRYELLYGRQAYSQTDDGWLFWGGLHVGNVGGGVGMIEDYTRIAGNLGVDIRYQHRVTALTTDGDRVTGVVVDTPNGRQQLAASSVILAAGGYHANPELLTEHLGAGWDQVVVRGTPYSTGDLISAALEVGAARDGDWDTVHAVQLDAWYAENSSNRELTNRLARLSYPLGIVVNRDGERFFDEGADFRNYTYSKLGKEVLAQPGNIAFQLFDSRTRELLRPDQYDMPGISVVIADTVEDLARQAGIDPAGLTETVLEFNASITPDAAFDPTIKDGRRADVAPPKSNWAVELAAPPFYAYPVTCGITFTYGGIASDVDGRVLDEHGAAIPGLFVSGEMLGGIYWGGYPGGAGLALGAVFGRRAGLLA